MWIRLYVLWCLFTWNIVACKDLKVISHEEDDDNEFSITQTPRKDSVKPPSEQEDVEMSIPMLFGVVESNFSSTCVSLFGKHAPVYWDISDPEDDFENSLMEEQHS